MGKVEQTLETVLREITHGNFIEPDMEIGTEEYERIKRQVLHAASIITNNYMQKWEIKLKQKQTL